MIALTSRHALTAAVLTLAGLACVGCASSGGPQGATVQEPEPGTAPVAASPAGAAEPIEGYAVVTDPPQLEFGRLPTRETHFTTLRLVNTSDEPHRVVACKSSCSCVATECPTGVLEPGDSVEMEVRVNTGARTKRIAKRLTFIVEDQPPLHLTVAFDAVSYVEAHPIALLLSNTRVTLQSVDDQPFAIVSVQPDVATFDDERRARHELPLHWDAWTDDLEPQITFFTDHPKCPMVLVNITGPGAE